MPQTPLPAEVSAAARLRLGGGFPGDAELEAVREKLTAGERLSRADGELLFRRADFHELGAWAARAAARRHGRRASYILSAHVNYSNYCTSLCLFCAFAREKTAASAAGFELTPEEVLERAATAAAEGATEFHIVGGLHPDLPFEYYRRLLHGLRDRFPRLGRKCFSASEINYFAARRGASVRETLAALRDAGLTAIPGGGAEILDDDLRRRVCPKKESAARWLEVHREAHRLGLPTNATILYGQVETPAQLVAHLLKLRELQDETGGFVSLVPLPYHPQNNRLKVAHGPSLVHSLRVFAVARLLLDNFPHLKAYRPALGKAGAQLALLHGADDLDGASRTEQVYRAAGGERAAAYGADELRGLIVGAGLEPLERDGSYRRVERRGDDPTAWTVAEEPPTEAQH